MIRLYIVYGSFLWLPLLDKKKNIKFQNFL